VKPDAILAAASQWLGLLPGLMSGTADAIAAWATIKAALQTSGIAADTAQLDFVIADAAVRKAREDALLDG
jgi:hypothetical protein